MEERLYNTKDDVRREIDRLIEEAKGLTSGVVTIRWSGKTADKYIEPFKIKTSEAKRIKHLFEILNSKRLNRKEQNIENNELMPIVKNEVISNEDFSANMELMSQIIYELESKGEILNPTSEISPYYSIEDINGNYIGEKDSKIEYTKETIETLLSAISKLNGKYTNFKNLCQGNLSYIVQKTLDELDGYRDALTPEEVKIIEDWASHIFVEKQKIINTYNEKIREEEIKKTAKNNEIDNTPIVEVIEEKKALVVNDDKVKQNVIDIEYREVNYTNEKFKTLISACQKLIEKYPVFSRTCDEKMLNVTPELLAQLHRIQDCLTESELMDIIKWSELSREEKERLVKEYEENVKELNVKPEEKKEENTIENESALISAGNSQINDDNIFYTYEELKEVYDKIVGKHPEFANQCRNNIAFINEDVINGIQDLNQILNEKEQSIIRHWSKLPLTTKMMFTNGKEQKVPTTDKPVVGDKDDDKIDLNNMTEEQLRDLVSKLSQENSDLKKENQGLRVTVNENTERLNKLEDLIANPNKKNVTVKRKDPKLMWKKIGKIAAYAAAIGVGATVALTLGPLGTIGLNLTGTVTKIVADNKLKKLQVEKLEIEKELESIENLEEREQQRKEKLEEILGREKNLKFAKNLVTTAQIASAVTSLGQGLYNSLNPTVPDPIPTTPDPVPSTPDPVPSIPDPVPTISDPTPSIPDISVGDSVNGADIDKLFDTRAWAANGVNPEEPLRQVIGQEFGSHYDTISAILPDGSVIPGTSVNQLSSLYPDAQIVGRVAAEHGYQGWDLLKEGVEAVAENTMGSR